jgi:hypothetical protein
MSLQQRQQMLDDQRGLCACCKEPTLLGGRNGAVIDHCHLTGKVREVLCNNCNRGLGMFYDSPQKMQLGAEYLLKHLK